MIDGAMNLLTFLASAFQADLWGPRGTNLIDTGAHFYEVYETSDGGFMSVGAIEPQFYAEFLDGIGMNDDPDFAKQHDQSKWPELQRRVADIFKTKTREEWTNIFKGRDAMHVSRAFAEGGRNPSLQRGARDARQRRVRRHAAGARSEVVSHAGRCRRRPTPARTAHARCNA